jgi:hypothetical protein
VPSSSPAASVEGTASTRSISVRGRIMDLTCGGGA